MEELKSQMGEVLPNALQIMALATKDAGLSVNGTVGELMKLMEQGKVATATVLPFFSKRMREAAQANGALGKALDSNRVAMNRFLFATTEAADTIFKAGFGEGLTDFFNTSGDSLRKLEPLWKALGRIIGSVFKLVSRGVELITPPLRLLSMILDSITEKFGDMSFVITTLFGAGLVQTAARMGKMTAAAALMRKAFFAMLIPIMKVVGALALVEELLNMLVFRDKEGLLFDASSATPNKSAAFSATNLFGENALTNFLDMPLNKMFKYFTGGEKETTIQNNITLQVDGEKLGEVVSETQASKDATRAVIYPLLVN